MSALSRSKHRIAFDRVMQIHTEQGDLHEFITKQRAVLDVAYKRKEISMSILADFHHASFAARVRLAHQIGETARLLKRG